MSNREDIVTELRDFGTNGYMMRAADEIELLRSTVTNCRIEIECLAAERGRLENQVDEFRECFGNLARERDELWNDLERLTMERDQARSTAAYLWARSAGGDEGTALREFYASKGWSLPQEKRHE